MSVQLLSWAYAQEAGGAANKMVLVTLADWSNQDGVLVGPSAAFLKTCEIDADQFKVIVTELADRGLLLWNGKWVQFEIETPPRIIMGQRKRVYDRDGHKCVYCGSPDDLVLDHVTPRSRGGSNKDDNLATACWPCNSKKGAKTPEEWLG